MACEIFHKRFFSTPRLIGAGAAAVLKSSCRRQSQKRSAWIFFPCGG
jgi:hypothetical protein